MKNLRRQVSDMLVDKGFRRNDRSHMLRLDEEFSFAVDTGPLGKRADIAPFVGVRHDSAERLLGELMELPDDPWLGTIGANVGYVLGRGYLWWEPPAEAPEVVAVIEEGLARLRPFLTLDKLTHLWELTDVRDPAWRYREIAILILRGEKHSVLGRLEEARKEFCKQRDEICEQFEGFEKNVRDRLARPQVLTT
jgi:hypothetical protein